GGRRRGAYRASSSGPWARITSATSTAGRPGAGSSLPRGVTVGKSSVGRQTPDNTANDGVRRDPGERPNHHKYQSTAKRFGSTVITTRVRAVTRRRAVTRAISPCPPPPCQGAGPASVLYSFPTVGRFRVHS